MYAAYGTLMLLYVITCGTRNHGRTRHAQPQHVHGTEAKIIVIGSQAQDRIQSHTSKQQTTPPRNNQEGKQRR